jgi:tRNA (pseudouridine54-N1)-methyltransferase
MRRFLVIGQRARASPDFLLVDIPSTSGRLDVLLRCLRAALLVSHGVRRDTIVYLSLLGIPERPRTLRFDGPAAKYMRPDERSLATLIKKALATASDGGAFVPVREGIAIADGDVACVWNELAGSALYLLEEGAPDLRDCSIPSGDVAFVIGDHLGLPAAVRDELVARGAQAVSVGPISLHAEDVVTLVANELDRRESRAPIRPAST